MSQDPHDQLVLPIRGAVAEYERTLIAERMRRGRLHKLQAGSLLPWTHPPSGYRLRLDRPRNPAGVWVDPAEASVVRAIFAHYVADDESRMTEDDDSLARLAQRLSARGVPTPTGRTIGSASTLRGLLTNPHQSSPILPIPARSTQDGPQ